MPPNWLDLTPYIQAAEYAVIAIIANILYGFDAMFLGGSYLVSALRQALVEGVADSIIKELYQRLGGVYTGLIFAAIMLYAVIILGRWVFGSWNITAPHRLILATVISGYMIANAATVVKSYEKFREESGKWIYTLAFQSFDGGVNLPSGEAVSPNCGLSASGNCGGSAFAGGILMIENVNQDLYLMLQKTSFFTTPIKFNQTYYSPSGNGTPVEPTSFPALPATSRTQLLARAANAPTRALMAISFSILGLLEEIVWFLLTVSTLVLFVSLAFSLIFAAYNDMGSMLTNVLQQLVYLIATTVMINLVMGGTTAVLVKASNNLIIFIGGGNFALLLYLALMWQAFSTMQQTFSSAFVTMTVPLGSAGAAALPQILSLPFAPFQMGYNTVKQAAPLVGAVAAPALGLPPQAGYMAGTVVSGLMPNIGGPSNPFQQTTNVMGHMMAYDMMKNGQSGGRSGLGETAANGSNGKPARTDPTSETSPRTNGAAPPSLDRTPTHSRPARPHPIYRETSDNQNPAQPNNGQTKLTPSTLAPDPQWLNAAVSAYASKGDPAKAWADSTRQPLGEMTGQVRSLIGQVWKANLNEERFTDIMREAAKGNRSNIQNIAAENGVALAESRDLAARAIRIAQHQQRRMEFEPREVESLAIAPTRDTNPSPRL